MKTLIVFSHLRWNFVFQRPQHLLTRLSTYYNIVFVEEPVDTGVEFLEVNELENIKVLVPHTLEKGWGFNDEQIETIGPMLKKWIDRNVDLSEGYGIWFYTPQALPFKDLFSPEFLVFDVMDELSMFAHAPESLKQREAKLLEIADVVIAGGPSLARAKQEHRKDTLSLPSSVDAKHYSPKYINVDKHYAETVIDKIPENRIGFFGVIDERLDIELVRKIVEFNPRWNLVMAGPVVKIDPSTLPQRENIHWIGSQSYQVLPQLVQSWDVCILPFALNDATKFISPTKTLEYMAAEKPIVSSAIHDVIELYGSVVEIGYDHDEFISKIEKFLAEDPVQTASRIILGNKIVEDHSWDETAEKIHDAIELAITKKICNS